MSDTIKIYINQTQPVKAITVAPTGARGADGAAGTNGTNGRSTNAWDYNAKTNATSGYPGNGYLLWNNATQTSATSIIVSHLTDDDTDIELFLSFFVINQKIFIQNRDDSSQNQVWRITGTPTVTGANTSTAYYTFPVTLVSSAGAAFNNNHSILFGQIVVATNAVTSATTSDGTANLDVASLVSIGSISTSGNTAEIYTTGNDSSIITQGDESRFATYGVNSHIQTQDPTSYVKSTNFSAYETTGASLKTSAGTAIATFGVSGQNFTFVSGTALTFNNTSYTYGTGAAAAHVTALGLPAANTIATLAGSETLTNKTLTSPAINSATIGTAATFNATTYTFGAGAAAAFGAALASSQRMYNVYVYDDFVSGTTSSGTIGALGWGAGGTGTYRGYEPNHAGIFRNSTTGTGYINLPVFSGNSTDALDGLTIESCFRLTDITNIKFLFGLSYVTLYLGGTGARVLTFDPSLSANWRLLHFAQTGGVTTYVDTGIPAVANDWVICSLAYANGSTVCKIRTTSNPTEVTVTNTGSYASTTNFHSAQFAVVSTSGTKSVDIDSFLMYGTTTRL